MTWIAQIFPEYIIHALGWTVLHSVWQGGMIALVLAIVLWSTRQKTARLRHELASGAIFLQFIVSICTFLWMIDQHSATQEQQALLQMVFADPELNATATKIPLDQKITVWLNQHMSLISALWFSGALIFLFRLAGGWWYVQRIKTAQTSAAPQWIVDAVRKISADMGVSRGVKVLQSGMAITPMVVGAMKPIILLPIAAVNQLNPREMEAILAHELAHVWRSDYISNLLLSLIEVLFYYHPAIWWMGSVVRTEREHCCDDIALSYCGDRMVYVKALVQLQELNKEQTPAFAMAAVSKKKPLLERVKRMLQPPTRQRLIWEKMTATGLLLAIIAFWALDAQARHKNTQELPTRKSAMMVDTIIRPEAPLEDATVNIIRIENGQRIKMSMERGEVKYLNVDGQTIPETDYRKYVDLIQEMQQEARSNHARVPLGENADHLSITIPDSRTFDSDIDLPELPNPPSATDFTFEFSPAAPFSPQALEPGEWPDGIQLELNGKAITLPEVLQFGDGNIIELNGLKLEKQDDGSYKLQGTDQDGEAMEMQIFPSQPNTPLRQKIEIDRNGNARGLSPRRSYSWSYSSDSPAAASPEDAIAQAESIEREFTFNLDVDRAEFKELEKNLKDNAREMQRLNKRQLEGYKKTLDQVEQAHRAQAKIFAQNWEETEKATRKQLEQTQLEHAKIMRAHADRNKKHADAIAKIRKELVNDGLIDRDNTNLSISINDNEVNINGKKLKGATADKYRNLYRSLIPQVSNSDYQ